jgi:replicative DNA helicase
MNYKEVTEELKNGLTVAEVIERLPVSLGLKPRGRDRLVGNCITGHSSDSGTCFHVFQDYYQCKSCDTSGDIFTAVMEGKSCSFPEAKQWLLEEFRPDLSRYNKKAGEEKALGLSPGYALKGLLFEEVVNYGKQLLYQEEGEEALQYLTEQRGYDLETLKKSEFIYLPEEQKVREYLLEKYSDKETSKEVRDYISGSWEKEGGKNVFKGLPLTGFFGDNFRLAFPYRNRYGTITGLLKRATAPAGITAKGKDNVRWDSTPGTTKKDLFNLYQYKQEKELLLVEGYPDALFFSALGIPTAAIGQGQLSRKHLEGLLQTEVREVTLSLDNDGEERGGKYTAAAIKLLREEAPGITVNVIPPKELGEAKDLDEFYRSQGEDALRAFLEATPVPYYLYQLQEITDKHNVEGGLSSREVTRYLEELVAYGTELPSIDKGRFFNEAEELTKPLGVTGADFIEASNSLYQRRKEEETKRGLEQLQAKAKRLQEEGSYLEAMEVLEEGLQELRSDVVGPLAEVHSWEDVLEDFTKEEDALKTGYPSLDKYVRIPRAVNSVIAGKPSHGKTTFMLNLLYRMATNYPGEAFFFFSYEEPRAKLYTKLLSIIAGEQLIDSQNNTEYLRYYLREQRTDNAKIEAAKKRLEELVNEGRLQVFSSPYTNREARQIIGQLQGLERPVGACFFDYIQKIPGEGKDLRNKVVGASGELLKAANESGAAVILGSQFNREGAGRKEPLLSDLTESSSIENDASLVLSLYNYAMDITEEERTEQGLSPEEQELKVKVLKQRERGNVGRSVTLEFNAPLQLIKDATEY